MTETHQDEIDADNGAYEAWEREQARLKRISQIPRKCPCCGTDTIVRESDEDYICPYCEQVEEEHYD